MSLFELIVALLLGGAMLTVWAERKGIPYPPLLALAGALAAVVPGVPEIALAPELALALFVAPVLLDAAYDASLRDLRANWVSVAVMVVVAVGATVGSVAAVARWVAPGAGIGWASAVALGAIVAPPDASAAVSVLRRLRPPHRLLVILEGESLLNDATALLVFRVAAGAAVSEAAGTGSVDWPGLPWLLLLTCGGGVALGVALGHVAIRVSTVLRTHMASWVLVQFLNVFAVWLLADALGLSAVITMVAFAMTVARLAPARMDGRLRIASYTVWEVAVFVLNVLAFILVGLQLKSILARVDGAVGGFLLFAGAVLLTCVAVRFAVAMAFNRVLWLTRRGTGAAMPTLRGGLVVSWCGMRGIVTLAAALALPPAFPGRDLVVFTAFAVTLGTLVVQGLTLGPLLQRLGLEDDDTVEREVRLGRRGALEAVHRFLGQDGTPAGAALQRKYAARLHVSDDAGNHDADAAIALRRAAIAAGREELSALRRRGLIGDDAMHRVEEELDLDELTADPRLRWGAPDPGAEAGAGGDRRTQPPR